jgi:DNA-binding XRE family transcriptional regulator
MIKNNLKDVCKKQNITFYGLSKGIGISPSTVYKYKKVVPCLETAIIIANFLKIPINEIWEIK